jgi:hypothetical protein
MTNLPENRSLTAAAGDSPPPDMDVSWDRADWQGMWQRTRTLEWRTLALVPADDETSTFGVANLIARLARDHGEEVQVADLRSLRLKHIDAFLEGARWEVSQGARLIFATRSALTSLATVPLARAADCAILCASLGLTARDAARTTIEQIGREHFLGSLLVRAPPAIATRKPRLTRREHRAKARP